MKKYLLAILVLATVSVSSVGAEAADSVHEVGVALGTTSGPFSRARLTDGNFSFSLVGSYAYALSSMVQIGPEVTVSYTETLTVFDFMGSLTLNFGGENDTIQSAFYVKPSVGLELVSTTGNSATSFIWGGGVLSLIHI